MVDEILLENGQKLTNGLAGEILLELITPGSLLNQNHISDPTISLTSKGNGKVNFVTTAALEVRGSNLAAAKKVFSFDVQIRKATGQITKEPNISLGLSQIPKSSASWLLVEKEKRKW